MGVSTGQREFTVSLGLYNRIVREVHLTLAMAHLHVAELHLLLTLEVDSQTLIILP